jgi:hypothetical protein
MKKIVLGLTLMILAAPLFAQTSQIGVAFGGSKRMFDSKEKNLRTDLNDGFDLDNSVREIWYGFQLEPDTVLKFKFGAITGPVGEVLAAPSGDPTGNALRRGRIEHYDVAVDYRFDEPFGSTGLFAAGGWYRQKSGLSDPTTQKLESDYGFNVGVNGDFPLTRTYGVVVEGAYHWINFSYKPRFVTLTAGLRMKF